MKKNVSFCESLCESNGTWTSLSERVSLIKLIVVVGGGLKLICFYIFFMEKTRVRKEKGLLSVLLPKLKRKKKNNGIN